MATVGVMQTASSKQPKAWYCDVKSSSSTSHGLRVMNDVKIDDAIVIMTIFIF